MDESDAWDAMTARLEEVYLGQQPRHLGTIRRYSEGGGAPLDGISIYSSEPPPHWHYVSFGLAPWGFEFSFRLRRGAEAEPPEWPVPFLQQLARYVFNTGNPFGHGHFIRWGGPITSACTTQLVGLVFVADTILGELPVGDERLALLSPVGITAEEYAMCEMAGPEDLLSQLRSDNPLGVVELGRASSARPATPG
jgi:suppressor of fused